LLPRSGEVNAMAFERILTTHTGSLPRPAALLGLLIDEVSGKHVDPVEREVVLSNAVRECVQAQLAAGIDLVSDGEMGKPSYATYAKDRLTGYGGEGHMPSPADLEEFPSYARRVMADPGVTMLRTPACIAPVAYQGLAALRRDLANLRGALEGSHARGFVTAESRPT